MLDCTFEGDFPKIWRKGRKKVKLKFKVQVKKKGFFKPNPNFESERFFRVTSPANSSKNMYHIV